MRLPKCDENMYICEWTGRPVIIENVACIALSPPSNSCDSIHMGSQQKNPGKAISTQTESHCGGLKSNKNRFLCQRIIIYRLQKGIAIHQLPTINNYVCMSLVTISDKVCGSVVKIHLHPFSAPSMRGPESPCINPKI